jgi:hypothetical protein
VADVTENDGAVPVPSATFSKEGYGTYYISAADVVLSAGMKAYIVTAKGDDGTLSYQKIADGDTSGKTVPAGTAVMLQVEPASNTQTFSMTLARVTAAPITQTNLLHGSDVAVETTGGAKYYKLSYGLDNTGSGGTDNSDVLGWYWGADGGAAFTSGAHKAWLAMPAAASRSFFGLPGEETGMGDATRLNNNEQITNNKWYSLDGRRLDGRPTAKGIYIVNGKKVIVK